MNYPKEIIFDAIEIVETICPKRILIIGESLQNIASDYQQQCTIINSPCDITTINVSTTLTHPAYAKRYDLAIVGETIETNEKIKSEHIFSKLRDLCTPKIIVLGDLTNSNWSKNELFGFGFIQHAAYKTSNSQYALQQQEDLQSKLEKNQPKELGLYHYNIDSYKKTPEWFNPKNWANPELWNKFWW